MPTTPAITLTANLESILDGTENAGWLRITLCGYGPALPVIPATCVLADAGVPLYVGPQVGSTPISVELWGNDVITPGMTFYEISVLDENKNVVQSGCYQLTGSGTFDLSTLTPIPPPSGFPLGTLFINPCAGSIPGSVFTAPGQVVAPFYNGIMVPRGLSLPTLSYTLDASGTVITFNFATGLGDRVDALCIV